MHFPRLSGVSCMYPTDTDARKKHYSYSLWNTLNWSVAHKLRSVYCLGTKNNSRFELKIAHILAKDNNNVFFWNEVKEEPKSYCIKHAQCYICQSILPKTVKRGRIKNRSNLMGYLFCFLKVSMILFHSERNILSSLAHLHSYQQLFQFQGIKKSTFGSLNVTTASILSHFGAFYIALPVDESYFRF